MCRETSAEGGRCLRGPAPPCSHKMATAYCYLSLFLLSTWVVLLLQPLQGAWGAPLEPVYPGDYATPEQMAQYATQLRRYINTQTRPRKQYFYRVAWVLVLKAGQCLKRGYKPPGYHAYPSCLPYQGAQHNRPVGPACFLSVSLGQHQFSSFLCTPTTTCYFSN